MGRVGFECCTRECMINMVQRGKSIGMNVLNVSSMNGFHFITVVCDLKLPWARLTLRNPDGRVC